MSRFYVHTLVTIIIHKFKKKGRNLLYQNILTHEHQIPYILKNYLTIEHIVQWHLKKTCTLPII